MGPELMVGPELMGQVGSGVRVVSTVPVASMVRPVPVVRVDLLPPAVFALPVAASTVAEAAVFVVAVVGSTVVGVVVSVAEAVAVVIANRREKLQTPSSKLQISRAAFRLSSETIASGDLAR